jgi:hypothetical protein
MRSFAIQTWAALITVAMVASTTQPAEATHRRAPDGWGSVRTVVHYGYYPRYHHVYVTHTATDPYAYRYAPRGYYPYYNSGYWKSAHKMRCRKRARLARPPYYRSWGYPDAHYHHRAWHAEHHGFIRRGHW